jgi:hypothetical protein
LDILSISSSYKALVLKLSLIQASMIPFLIKTGLTQ